MTLTDVDANSKLTEMNAKELNGEMTELEQAEEFIREQRITDSRDIRFLPLSPLLPRQPRSNKMPQTGAEVQMNVRFDVEQMAQTFTDEQLRAVMNGMAQVIVASRTPPPAEPQNTQAEEQQV